jgi:hypothetical protein
MDPLIMKNTFIVSALAAVLGLALAGVPVSVKAQSTNAAPAAAATTAPASTPSAAATSTKKKSKYTQYAGTIKSLSASSAVVTTKKGDITLAVDATTTFKVNKKKAAATDFATGDSVTGSYATNADGTFTAHSINKKTATK